MNWVNVGRAVTVIRGSIVGEGCIVEVSQNVRNHSTLASCSVIISVKRFSFTKDHLVKNSKTVDFDLPPLWVSCWRLQQPGHDTIFSFEVLLPFVTHVLFVNFNKSGPDRYCT